MGKFLILLLVIFAVIFIARTLGAAGRREREEKTDVRRVGKEERVVPCAHCGIHVPESAAIEWQGKRFCSDEHRRLFGQ
jgi:uncharacterized protein